MTSTKGIDSIGFSTMTSYSITSWKDYFFKSPHVEYSNNFLKLTHESIGPLIKFVNSISEISKKLGVTLLALDTSGGNLQLFHYPTVLGGNWCNKSKKLSIDSILFHPTTQMVSCLWSGDFMWIIPDHPSSVSVFFCPEIPMVNSIELEKDRTFALADKVKHGDLEKMMKQKFTLPLNIMEMVWMTQNFHSIVSLCFDPQSHSAISLEDWARHMYHNRLMYKGFYLPTKLSLFKSYFP
jgi:hypothetical protein